MAVGADELWQAPTYRFNSHDDKRFWPQWLSSGQTWPVNNRPLNIRAWKQRLSLYVTIYSLPSFISLGSRLSVLTRTCSTLEDALLLEEVTALLAAADACVAKANPAQANTQLLREGFRNTHSLYRGAHRDLKACHCKDVLSP